MDDGSSREEIDRLRRVYEDYDRDALVRERWNASNAGNRAILLERSWRIGRLFERERLLALADRNILDIGCGGGRELARFAAMGALPENLYGIDLSPERIAIAHRSHPGMRFCCANGEMLPFPAAMFDLIAFFTVFSSIFDPGLAQRVAREAIRVLRPQGAILVYDLRRRNPKNPNVRPITRSDLHEYFPGFGVKSATLTVIPPLTRRLGAFCPVLYPLLGLVPLLRTHRLALLRAPARIHG